MNMRIRVPKDFQIIAHRGASGYAPENTLSAFRLAEKMSIRDIELDVQMTKDQHLVIVHDLSLDRYGHPGIRVSDLLLKEATELDMGSWYSPFLFSEERLISLETLFSEFGTRMRYVIEIKENTPAICRELHNRIEQHGLRKNVTITSFFYDILCEMKSLNKEIPLGWLLKVGEFTHFNIRKTHEAGFQQICPNANDTDVDLITEAHKKKLLVRAHGVKTREDITRLINSKCDGMTINWPDWVIHGD